MSRKWWTAAGSVGGAIVLREAVVRAREADLTSQVVLITGASSGLGLELARALAREGCRLVICARNEADLERARQDLTSRGAEVLAVRCDVANRDDVQHLVDVTLERFGSIDLLICNAGIIQVGQFSSMKLSDFEQAMDVTFYGSLYSILAVVPHMRKRGRGRIALVASIGGVVSVPYLLPYNASKFAVLGLGEGLRAELGSDGISVTTIIPGLLRTGSYVNAHFSGNPEGRESLYRVFSALSSLPLLTGNAEAAASAYVRAIKRGDARVVYPPLYSLVSWVHGLAPATTMAAMGLATRLMPETGDETTTVRGEAIDRSISPGGIWHMLTALGRDAHARMQPRSDAEETS